MESGDKTPVETGNSLTASSSTHDLTTEYNNGCSNISRQSSSGYMFYVILM